MTAFYFVILLSTERSSSADIARNVKDNYIKSLPLPSFGFIYLFIYLSSESFVDRDRQLAPVELKKAAAVASRCAGGGRRILEKYANRTSLHGIPRAIITKSAPVRCFWAAVFLVAVSMFCRERRSVSVDHRLQHPTPRRRRAADEERSERHVLGAVYELLQKLRTVESVPGGEHRDG